MWKIMNMMIILDSVVHWNGKIMSQKNKKQYKTKQEGPFELSRAPFFDVINKIAA